MFARLYRLFVEDAATGSGWRIPALDGLRACAALSVLVAHAWVEVGDGEAAPNPLIAWGGQGGVTLFFSLSGFLLYLPWLRSHIEHTAPPRFAHYAARRCLRIMPAYYASVLILAFVPMAFGGAAPGLGRLVMNFIFLPNLTSRFPAFLSVYWTLQVEEFFYWLMPFGHRWLFARHPARGVVLVVLGSAAYLAAILTLLPEGRWHVALQQLPFFAPCFAFGMATAVIWKRVEITPTVARVLLLAGIVSYSATAFLADGAPDWATAPLAVLMAPGCSAMVLGAASGGADGFLSHPVMRWFGAISYSLYLWHFVFVRLVPPPALFSDGPLLRITWALVVSTLVASLSYLLVERPFLRMRPATHPRASERSVAPARYDTAGA